MAQGLRLMVYDRTCVGSLVGLSTAWRVGGLLYRGLSRLDATFGAASWDEALAWLAQTRAGEPIAEIQHWSHGRWGRVLIGRDVLDARALSPGHRLHRGLSAVRERLLPDGASLLWLRTCEAFGAQTGLDFARRLADGLGARVAGHTHIIGAIQSGLHGLRPGHAPDWSPSEGLAEGTPERPTRAFGSRLGAPRTIHCLDGVVPPEWFA